MKQYVGTSLKLVVSKYPAIWIAVGDTRTVLTYCRELDLCYFCYGPTLNKFYLCDTYLTPILTV